LSELLQELLKTPSPCGSESMLCELIEKNTVQYSDKQYIDKLGNLIIRKAGNGKRLMLTANMDEPAIAVNYIEDSGKLRFSYIGNTQQELLVGCRVIFQNGVSGIICADKKAENARQMYIEIGCESRQEAEKKISAGAFGVIYNKLVKLENNKIVGSGMDNKIGILILTEVIKRLVSTNYDTYLVFTTQKNMSNKGVKAAVFDVGPESASTVEGVCEGAEVSKGACIKVRDKGVICQSEIVDKLVSIAKTKEIPYQLEASDNISQAGDIYKSGSGVITCGVGYPVKKCSPESEIISLDDLQSAVSLILSFLAM